MWVRVEHSERAADDPDLTLSVLITELFQPPFDSLPAGLFEEVLEAIAKAVPQVARPGASSEDRDVAIGQVTALGGNQPFEEGAVCHTDPQLVQVAVGIQGVTKPARMEALDQQEHIAPGRAHDQANFRVDKG